MRLPKTAEAVNRNPSGTAKKSDSLNGFVGPAGEKKKTDGAKGRGAGRTLTSGQRPSATAKVVTNPLTANVRRERKQKIKQRRDKETVTQREEEGGRR